MFFLCYVPETSTIWPLSFFNRHWMELFFHLTFRREEEKRHRKQERKRAQRAYVSKRKQKVRPGRKVGEAKRRVKTGPEEARRKELEPLTEQVERKI